MLPQLIRLQFFRLVTLKMDRGFAEVAHQHLLLCGLDQLLLVAPLAPMAAFDWRGVSLPDTSRH